MFPELSGENNSTSASDVILARWPGVVLSFLVPGFGLYRAGLTRRGIFWFFGMFGLQFVAALALAIPSIPLILGMAIIPVFVIAMLMDSFRAGEMTRRKWLVFIVCFLLLAVIPAPFAHVIHSFSTPTKSMEPTLCPGDHFIVSRIAYLFSPVKRGDVVAFRTQGISGIQNNSIYVKRVAAFAGEKVQIRNGAFLVNGKKMTASDGLPLLRYSDLPVPGALLNSEWSSYVVPEGNVFVIGDNIDHSADSRLWGGIPKENIYGKAVKIYYPFSRIGPVK